MSNVRILPDENLGGVLCEFVEVDRKANVGDYVYYIPFGDIQKVTKLYDNAVGLERVLFVYHENYRTLEPTDIVRINNERYRLVDRKAKVGDRFINKAGEFHTVNTELMRDSLNMGKYFFRLIEPVTEPELIEVDTRHASPQVIDMLANLAQRVTELERELSEIKKVTNTEMGARSVHTVRWLEVKDEIDTLHANQRKLAEETTNRLDRHSERIRELAEMIGERKPYFKAFHDEELVKRLAAVLHQVLRDNDFSFVRDGESE
jgi:HD-GYP domain-containing protein (c-di-GMP phosphodiesterase class II)